MTGVSATPPAESVYWFEFATSRENVTVAVSEPSRSGQGATETNPGGNTHPDEGPHTWPDACPVKFGFDATGSTCTSTDPEPGGPPFTRSVTVRLTTASPL